MSSAAPAVPAINGAAFTVGLVAARYNPALTDALLDTVRGQLLDAGVKPGRLEVIRVPGSAELPVAALWLAESGRCDCVVALGVLVKGDTAHHRIVGQAATDALQRVALATRIPVINGVLVVENARQAAARCHPRSGRGPEFACAALAMAALKRAQGGRA